MLLNYLVSDNIIIRKSKEEKVLGITFDSKFNFSKHLTSITKKANVNLNTLTKIYNSRAKDLFNIIFYKASIKLLSFNLDFCSKKALHRLSKIHERSLRHIHQDYVSNFGTLSGNVNEKPSHQKFLEFLRVEVYKYLMTYHLK